MTGLPGGLEFTGSPQQLADVVEERVERGGSDGFALQPATVPEDLGLPRPQTTATRSARRALSAAPVDHRKDSDDRS